MKQKVVAIISSVLLAVPAYAANVDNVLDSSVDRNKAGVQAQKTVEKLDDEIRSLTNEYRNVVAESQGLDIYLQQLNKQMSFQQQELDRLDGSLGNIQGMEREITPLMLRMIDSLESFVKLDLPFQQKERLAKIEEVKGVMDKSSATVAERYRRVLNAYQDEIEYGRTLETYTGPLEINQQEVDVDFLRVGRLSLVFMTKDGKKMGVWNPKVGNWEALDASHKSKIVQAMRIAGEQAAPDLIRIPLVAPE